jgi:hypothetical protein
MTGQNKTIVASTIFSWPAPARLPYPPCRDGGGDFGVGGEVQKLRKQALRGFREVSNSKLDTSGKPSLNKFAPSINIYNMAGVLRMAWPAISHQRG